jgi:hypothetical protein
MPLGKAGDVKNKNNEKCAAEDSNRKRKMRQFVVAVRNGTF